MNDKVKYLKITLFRCVNDKEKLDVILDKQKCSLDKVGLGFDPSKKKKMFSGTKFNFSNGKNTSLMLLLSQVKSYC